GCESNKQPVSPPPALSVSVNVIATPGQPAPNRSLSYCVGTPIPPADLQVTTATGTVKWYSSGNPIAVYTGTNPTATDLGINNLNAGLHVFELTQTESVNGCEGPIPGSRPIFTIEIKALPSLTLTADVADLNTICTTGGTFKVTAFDQGIQTSGGLWSGTGLAGALSPTPFGEVIVNPVDLNPDNYTLQYDYTSGTSGCSNNASINFKILPRIIVTFNPLDSCDKAFVRLNNLSMVDYGALPTTPATAITETSWLFQDGSSLAFGNGAVPSGTNGGRTEGTYFSPLHKFSTVGGFTVQTTMRTSDGCVYTGSKQVNIKPKPVVNFSWRNPCRIDGTTSTDTTRTVFQASETSTPPILLSAYDWNFKVNNILDYFSAGTGANPEVRYNVDGVDEVRLIATSVDGCRDTIQKPVYVVPKAAPIDLSNTYLQTFTTDGDRWLTGGQNSSWQYGTPAGSVINTPGEKAWVTNLTGPSNTGEKSWVLSRCFNFSSATKPAIALDIWADTPAGIDGAVLQVNTSGNIESDANWTVVGAVGQGVNWYDQGGIASKPGNQPAGDVGWSGSALDGRYLTWKSARFKLDNLIGKPRAIFRIAYASTVSAREGFAFDNVFIGERSRSVLVENFTNTSASANSNAHNDAFRLFEKNSVDIVKLQYHTGFPGTDPINALNPLMHNARTTFYGIGATPTFRVDGEFDTGTPLSWLTPLFNDRTLEPAQLKIESSQVKVGAEVKINTYIKNNSTTSVFPAGSHVFTVIVEKLITDNAYKGTPNDTLLFVAKQMLPSPAGVLISTDIAPGDSLILPEITWDTRNLIDVTQGAIIIFVQSIQGGNKEVHQAKVFSNPPIPDVITAIENPAFAEKIEVYPNPASHELNIVLPEPAQAPTPIVLIDSHGRNLMEQAFLPGQQMKTLNTSQLADGLYIIQLRSQNGTVRKKVLIIHSR
ncbi:MAG: T9SS type A sorting domain-containing protein, partial [Cyclobacteriaceae bacterium]